ncbi:MAG: hypothetical protein ABH824_05915 [Nanoarchaeota archaeon]
MNEEQKKLLLKEKEQLKESKGANPTLVIIGFLLVFIGLVFGYKSGFVILSFELIIGVILIIFGFRDKEGKRIKEIDYILAGDKAKKIKTTHKVRKIICSKCNEEVKENWNKCKKCKNFLAAEGAVKIKNIDVED